MLLIYDVLTSLFVSMFVLLVTCTAEF